MLVQLREHYNCFEKLQRQFFCLTIIIQIESLIDIPPLPPKQFLVCTYLQIYWFALFSLNSKSKHITKQWFFLRNMIWRERRAYRWSQKWGGGNNRRTQTKKRVTWLEQRTNNRSHKNHTVAEYYTYCTQIEGEGEVKILQTETPGQSGSFCTFGMIKNTYALTMKCCRG